MIQCQGVDFQRSARNACQRGGVLVRFCPHHQGTLTALVSSASLEHLIEASVLVKHDTPFGVGSGLCLPSHVMDAC